MYAPEPLRVLAPLAALDAQIANVVRTPVPLVVVRLPELERIAWRRGLRAARRIEQRATAAFATAARRVLRSGDLVAHDAGSDAFVAALVAPTREGEATAAAIDTRSALARIAATMESAVRREVLTGWTMYEAHRDGGAIALVVERALVRGAQERERYAFFSAIGHELRTPLSSIRGYLETLLDEDVDEETARRFLRIAYGEAMRMSRLIEGMFEISLLDLHATFPKRGVASLPLALDVVRDACARTAAAAGVTLDVAAAPSMSVPVDGDRLALVLINLVDNAIKHGRPAGTVCVRVDLVDAHVVRLHIDDDGPGIAESDRERVFALGERGLTRAPGSGIGLALVRLILQRVGGHIEIGDAPLGGARFTITLPRRDEPREA